MLTQQNNQLMAFLKLLILSIGAIFLLFISISVYDSHVPQFSSDVSLLSSSRSLQEEQQAIIPPSSSSESKTRHAIIHIGPPKTASTTLQISMTRDTNAFKRDGYYVNGPFEELVFCLKKDERSMSRCPPDVRKNVNEMMRDAETNYDHLFVSSEGFGDVGTDLDDLESLLKPWNDVSIVMMYRRIFEWLPSKYHQYHKKYTKHWTFLGRDPYPSQVEYLTKERINFYVRQRYVPKLMDFYGQKFSQISVFNMHDVTLGDVVPDFYCRMIPDAANACLIAKQRTTRREKKHIKMTRNPSLVEIDYDRLARVAAQLGLIGDDVSIARAAAAAQNRQEVTLGLTVKDFPQECMTADMLAYLLELSMDTEKNLFPEWFARAGGEEEFKEAFHEASRTKLCNPDVGAILNDEKWQAFFSSINEETATLVN